MDRFTGALQKQYAEQANCAASPRQATQRENLHERRAVLEAQLERVTHAIEMLDKYPDFENVMNAVMQANY